MRTFDLNWQGWFYSSQLPNDAGVYCVWVAPVQKNPDGTLTVANRDAKLVYIGESDDIAARVSNHEKVSCWENERQTKNDSIVFTHVILRLTDVDESWRKSVENCLIATHKPPCNDEDLTYHYQLSVLTNNSGLTFGKLVSSHKCKGSNDPEDP